MKYSKCFFIQTTDKVKDALKTETNKQKLQKRAFWVKLFGKTIAEINTATTIVIKATDLASQFDQTVRTYLDDIHRQHSIDSRLVQKNTELTSIREDVARVLAQAYSQAYISVIKYGVDAYAKSLVEKTWEAAYDKVVGEDIFHVDRAKEILTEQGKRRVFRSNSVESIPDELSPDEDYEVNPITHASLEPEFMPTGTPQDDSIPDEYSNGESVSNQKNRYSQSLPNDHSSHHDGHLYPSLTQFQRENTASDMPPSQQQRNEVHDTRVGAEHGVTNQRPTVSNDASRVYPVIEDHPPSDPSLNVLWNIANILSRGCTE